MWFENLAMRNMKSLSVAKAGKAPSGDARYACIRRPLFHLLRLCFSLLQLLVQGWLCCIPAYSSSISIFRRSIPSAYQYRARPCLPLHLERFIVWTWTRSTWCWRGWHGRGVPEPAHRPQNGVEHECAEDSCVGSHLSCIYCCCCKYVLLTPEAWMYARLLLRDWKDIPTRSM